MLARLSVTTARFVDVCFEPTSGLSTQQSGDGENSLVVDLQAFRGLLPQTPEKIWNYMVAYGRAVTPLYTNLHDALSSDFENIAQILLDLEFRHQDPLYDVLPVGLLDEEEQNTQSTTTGPLQLERAPSERPPRKRRRSSQVTSPIVIPSTHPSAPSITITLAPPQSRETSCRIPYQNHAFGNLLTVPSHPVFNRNHPPMALERCLLPNIDKWKWENGHWQAILPTLEEQRKRGLFSRAIPSRRKSCRPPGALCVIKIDPVGGSKTSNKRHHSPLYYPNHVQFHLRTSLDLKNIGFNTSYPSKLL